MAKDNFYRRLQKQMANRKKDNDYLRIPLILLVIFVLTTGILLAARRVLTSGSDGTADTIATQADVASRQFNVTAPDTAADTPTGTVADEPTITPLPQAVGAQPTITPLPVAVQAAQPPPGDGLVGPEWTVVARGDINQDGKLDVVAFKWPNFPVDSPIWQTYKASYPAHSVTSPEIVIVQRQDDGTPQTLLATSPSGISADSSALVGYPAGSVAGYLLHTSEGATVPVSLIPVNSDFSGFQSEVGLYWDPALQQFRVFGGGQL